MVREDVRHVTVEGSFLTQQNGSGIFQDGIRRERCGETEQMEKLILCLFVLQSLKFRVVVTESFKGQNLKAEQKINHNKNDR